VRPRLILIGSRKAPLTTTCTNRTYGKWLLCGPSEAATSALPFHLPYPPGVGGASGAWVTEGPADRGVANTIARRQLVHKSRSRCLGTPCTCGDPIIQYGWVEGVPAALAASRTVLGCRCGSGSQFAVQGLKLCLIFLRWSDQFRKLEGQDMQLTIRVYFRRSGPWPWVVDWFNPLSGVRLEAFFATLPEAIWCMASVVQEASHDPAH
jgi:hypothetical protein